MSEVERALEFRKQPCAAVEHWHLFISKHSFCSCYDMHQSQYATYASLVVW